MILPSMVSEPQQTTQKVVEFRGINLTNYPTDGEMRDSMNISADNYPCLSPRKGRKVLYSGLASPTNMYSAEGHLFYIDGTKFYVDGVEKGTLTAGEKAFACITKRLVIFPDKKIYDINSEIFSDIGATFVSSGDVVFKKGSPTEDASVTVTTSNAFEKFKAGDAIEISGCTADSNNNKSVVIKSVSGNVLKFEVNTFLADVTETAVITFERNVPDLDYICEYNNRVWGVSNAENAIYGSKLGDPYNFYVYAGLSTDSYTVTVGSQGRFTGIMPYSSMLIFFKENTIHKLYGAKPSAFQIMTNFAQGIKEGSEKSLAIIDDTVIYFANSGVMCFTGNLPESISDVFGVAEFTRCVGTASYTKYYCCLTDAQGKYVNMVYDLKRNVWLKEDDNHITDYAFHNGHVVYLDNETKEIVSCDHGEIQERFKWFAEFAETNEKTIMAKGYSKLYIEAEGEPNAHFKISVRNGLKEPWRVIYTGAFTRRKAATIPIIMGGSNLCQLRIDGEGYVKIFSVSREIRVKGEPV